MTNNEFVEKLYKKENELVRICGFHGVFDCDDIIQNLYLKLLLFESIDRYVKDNEPNMYIVFMIIRNMIIDQKKREQKYMMIEIDSNIAYSEYVYESRKGDIILNELEHTTNWYEKKILTYYIEEQHSIRSLAIATQISANVIQKVFRKFKLKCIEKYEKSNFK